MHVLLDQIAPGLGQKLELLPLAKSRRIVARACDYASRRFVGLEPPVRELLKAISTGNGLSETEAAEARALAAAADDHYFTLKDHGAPEIEWSMWFEKARLLTAVAHAGGAGGTDDVLDAVYELCFTCDNPSEILALVQSATTDK